MRNTIILAIICMAFTGPAAAVEMHTSTFDSPCNRGPFPKVRIINSVKKEFIAFLLEKRPSLTKEQAAVIGRDLCDDIDLYADADLLTERLHNLFARYPQ